MYNILRSLIISLIIVLNISQMAQAAPSNPQVATTLPELSTVIAASSTQSDSLLPPAERENIAGLRQSAAQNDATAQAALADKYYSGDQVEQRPDLAIQWYQLAAAQNQAYANYMLALIYAADDLGAPQNLVTANEARRRADNQPDAARAQAQVAAYLLNHNTPLYNPQVAMNWYEMAANNGDIEAQIALGHAYESGQSVIQNNLVALKWYSEAANQGSPIGQYHLGMILLTLPQEARNTEDARYWIQEAALNHLPVAQYRLGDMYYYGIGGEQSDVQAYAWWTVSQSGLANPDLQQKTDDLARLMSPDDLATGIRLAMTLSND